MMLWNTLKPRTGDALVIVDLQNDFLPGGSLATPDGDAVVPVLNRYVALFQGADLPILATRCWHPPDHRAFREQGGAWPAHCVAWSEGAEFARRLKLPDLDRMVVITKGERPDRHPDSGFDGTDLEDHLRHLAVQRLFVGGLTTEHSVYHTIKDGLSRGFDMVLLQDATRPLDEAAGQPALDELQRLGVDFIEYDRIAA